MVETMRRATVVLLARSVGPSRVAGGSGPVTGPWGTGPLVRVRRAAVVGPRARALP